MECWKGPGNEATFVYFTFLRPSLTIEGNTGQEYYSVGNAVKLKSRLL